MSKFSVPKAPFVVNLTKRWMAEHPGYHVITDANDEAVALLPIRDDDKQLPDGQWSYAGFVVAALNGYVEGKK